MGKRKKKVNPDLVAEKRRVSVRLQTIAGLADILGEEVPDIAKPFKKPARKGTANDLIGERFNLNSTPHDDKSSDTDSSESSDEERKISEKSVRFHFNQSQGSHKQNSAESSSSSSSMGGKN